MRFDSRIILFFGCNALLLFLAQRVSSALSGQMLQLILLGPMVVMPALYLRHGAFFVCTALTGLWVDATSPVPFGFYMTVFLACGTAIFQMRIRFRAEHNYHPILIAHVANAAAIAAMVLFLGGQKFVFDYWLQVGITAALSHLVLLGVAPWFFDLQRLFLELLNLETEPDDFPVS